MAHVEADALVDPCPLYLTASLGDAKKVEALLTSRGVDYAVETEEIGRSLVFGSPRHGAVFYVAAAQLEYSRSVLAEGGFARGLI
jgi:hypothetical protein